MEASGARNGSIPSAGWHLFVTLQLAGWGFFTWLSFSFAFDSPGQSRPLLVVLGLLAVLFGLHLMSLRAAITWPIGRPLFLWVFGVGLAMRLVVLPSLPVQEVDIYRYLWDGNVLASGVSPFRFSPSEVLDHRSDSAVGKPLAEGDLQRLSHLVMHDPPLAEILRRVHYPEVPTVYPPVSQAVFALTALMTPEESGVWGRTVLMKSVLVGFDLGVMLLLWKICLLVGKHPAWTVIYGWSPLVLKEFANSGHLDSIALFFLVAAIWTMLLSRGASLGRGAALSAVALGLGVGAKLFPIVLLPVFAAFVLRRSGLRRAVAWCTFAVAGSVVAVAPMVLCQRSSAPLAGLAVFLSRWEMNDLIFMVIAENVRPEGSVAGQPSLWFVVVPDEIRKAAESLMTSISGAESERAAFLWARGVTAAIFLGVVTWGAARVYFSPRLLLESCFLTLAWLWFLSPTQNPWYWIWALPLVPMARSRLWIAVSGLAMIYYLRFWFLYHHTGHSIWGTPYEGVAFLDFVVVWLEFGPLLALLMISLLRRLAYRRLAEPGQSPGGGSADTEKAFLSGL